MNSCRLGIIFYGVADINDKDMKFKIDYQLGLLFKTEFKMINEVRLKVIGIMF